MEALRHEIARCILLVVVYIKLSRSSPPCSWSQITRMDGNMTSCWDCPKCPHGFGLTPQCASYIERNVHIQCVPCEHGVTYSDSYDISSCKPCSICGENEVTIRPCNVTHNAICGKCKPWFYREITEDCWPCTKCCSDSTPDDYVPQCLSQGLPSKHSCRLDYKTEACAKATAKPTTMRTKPATHRSSCQSKVINSTVMVVHYYHINNNTHPWMGVAIALFVIFAVGIPVLVLTACRLRFKHQPFNYLIEQEKAFDSCQPLSVV